MKSNLNHCVSKDTCQKPHQKNNNSSNLMKETQKSFNDSRTLKLGRGIALKERMFSKKFFSVLVGSFIVASSALAEEPEIPKYLGGGSSGGTKVHVNSAVGVALDSLDNPAPLIPDSILLAELKKRRLKIDPRTYRGIFQRAKAYRLDDIQHKLPFLPIEKAYDKLTWFAFSKKDFQDNPKLYQAIFERYFSSEPGTKKPIFQTNDGERDFVLVNEDIFREIRTQDIPLGIKRHEERTGKKMDPDVVFSRLEEQAWIHEAGRYLVEDLYMEDNWENDEKVRKLDRLFFRGEEYNDVLTSELFAQALERRRPRMEASRSEIIKVLAPLQLERSIRDICIPPLLADRIALAKKWYDKHRKGVYNFQRVAEDDYYYSDYAWSGHPQYIEQIRPEHAISHAIRILYKIYDNRAKALEILCRAYGDSKKWPASQLQLLKEAEAYRKKNASAQPILKSIKTALGSTAEKTNKGAVIQGRARSVKAVKPPVTPTSSRTLKLKGTAGKADL